MLRELRNNPHKLAAVTYVGLGILVILITFGAGLVPPSRSNPIRELSVGAVLIPIFAIFIYRGWWLITALLILSNSWRAFTYFNDGLGRHVELSPYSVTQIDPQPVALINAVLMAVIVTMLVRAAHAGFSAWRTHRQVKITAG